jgi:AAA domain/Bifunctional DNA primase/polymerase, N-terminal
MTFDPDFASLSDYAIVYRELGLQVVPAGDPKRLKEWKRPLVKWREHENKLVDDDTFDKWFGDNGEYVRNRNIGIVCGACSGGVFIVDLDLHKNDRARAWWEEIQHKARAAHELDTVYQHTGGGGLQYLFRAPEGWTPPTCKTDLGVDIRGQGGFAVVAPSLHESGSHYRWADGREPWSFEIAVAPEWLTKEIDQLARQYGGGSSGGHVRTESPSQVFNEFGKQIDGREAHARDLIWSIVVDLYRECPIKPHDRDIQSRMMEAFGTYESRVKTRLAPRAGKTNADLLEEEGRGLTSFAEKWRVAVNQWETKVKAAAAIPKPQKAAGAPPEGGGPPPDPFAAGASQSAPEARQEAFPVSTVFPIIGEEIPPRDWAVPGLIMHGHVGLTIAPGGSGKSTLEVQKALMMATGVPWARWRPRQRERVLLINSEDDYDEMSRRLYAAAQHMRIDQRDLKDWIYLARNPDSIVIAQTDPKTKAVIRTQLYTQLIKTIVENEIGVVVVDPFAETFIGDENSNSEMKWAAIAWREIARVTNAAVQLVHHTRKYAGQMAGDSDAARGGGALVNAARIVSTLFTMTEEEAEKFGIDPEERLKYVRHDDAKANLTLVSGKARWFEKVSVTLPNGRNGIPPDEIGVLSPWEPPGVFDGVSTSQIHACLDRITDGLPDGSGQYYTFSKTSLQRYVGTAVEGELNVDTAQADRIVQAWKQSGLLIEEAYADEKRGRVTKIVRVVNEKRPGTI